MCALVACVPERSTERKPRHFSTLCPSLDGLFLFYRNGIMRTCPQSNSFRCFCTASVCQYVYYRLRRVAARQSSRHLASMQGARIKACGSFPPQVVLALTLSKITRRHLTLRRFAGTPKQNHPKIFCFRVREVPCPAIPATCEPLISFRVGIPHKQFEYALYDLGRVYTDDLHKSSSMHSLI